MAMIPLRNGVVINSEEYHCAFRADVYQLDDEWWIFRINNHHMPWDLDPDFEVKEIHHRFDEGNMHGTIFVHESKLMETPKSTAWMNGLLRA